MGGTYIVTPSAEIGMSALRGNIKMKFSERHHYVKASNVVYV